MLVDLILDLTGVRKKAKKYGEDLGRQIFNDSSPSEDESAQAEAYRDPSSKFKSGKKKAGPGSLEYTVIFSAIVLLIGLVVLANFVRSRNATPKVARTSTASAESSELASSGSAGLGTGRLIGSNEAQPGAKIRESEFVGAGHQTVFFLHSPHCHYSNEMKPLVERLARTDSDVRVVQVNIDRSDADGIDYHSPAGEQFAVHAVPAFVVFDEKGQPIADGDDAKDIVRTLMQKNRVVR